VAVLLAAACGGPQRNVQEASEKPEPMRPEAAPNTPKPDHLTIVEMTIRAGDHSIKIGADGNIEDPKIPDPVATLAATGEVFHPNGGLLLTLNSDGTLTGAHLQLGELSQLVIGAGGSVQRAGQPWLEIGEGGEILRGNQAVAVIEGPEEGRRAAMLVFLLASFDARGQGSPGAPDDGAAPPPAGGGEAGEPPGGG
jgi:hypothetical protein